MPPAHRTRSRQAATPLNLSHKNPKKGVPPNCCSRCWCCCCCWWCWWCWCCCRVLNLALQIWKVVWEGRKRICEC